MEPEDVEACLGRHATSKIAAVEDLERLATFGFRGEALYAAAAVSKLTITSAVADAKTGWRVRSENGRVVARGPAPSVRAPPCWPRRCSTTRRPGSSS